MPDASDIFAPVLRAGRSPLIRRARQLMVVNDQLLEARDGRAAVVLLGGFCHPAWTCLMIAVPYLPTFPCERFRPLYD